MEKSYTVVFGVTALGGGVTAAANPLLLLELFKSGKALGE